MRKEIVKLKMLGVPKNSLEESDIYSTINKNKRFCTEKHKSYSKLFFFCKRQNLFKLKQHLHNKLLA